MQQSDYTSTNNAASEFGITTQPTYNSCANQCDSAAAAGLTCAAFSWTASSGNCTLFRAVANGVSLETGMVQTNGVHSGRWLSTTSGTTVSSTPLQLYLASPIPFPVGPISQGSQTARDYPGGTNSYFNYWNDNDQTTLLDLSVVLPGYNWTIFGLSTTTLWVTANFWFTNTNLAVTASTQNTYSTLGKNNDTAPGNFPASNLPAYTLAPFWTNGHLIGASQQGIYYQIDQINATTGRYGISIEWYFSHYQQDNNVFHAITTYDTGSPGIWTNYFFSAGQTGSSSQDQGLRQTVGGQGNLSTAQYFTYCAGTQNCILPGDRMRFNTTQASMSAVANYSSAWFNPATYGVGTWTYQTRPRSTS